MTWRGVNGYSGRSGLFIWATTVAKFLREQIDTLGKECLDGVLGMITAEDLSDINDFYNLILRQIYRRNWNAGWEYEKFRRIMGAIVVLRKPLKLYDLRLLLDIRQTDTSTPVDLVNFIRRLRTVLVAGVDVVDDNTFPRLHKSFYEFIISREVPSQLRIDPNISEMELVCCCLSRLSFAHADIAGSHLPETRYDRLWGRMRRISQLQYDLRSVSTCAASSGARGRGRCLENPIPSTFPRARKQHMCTVVPFEPSEHNTFLLASGHIPDMVAIMRHNRDLGSTR